MRRREFIALIGGVATWPCAARGQQSERTRLIGILLPIAKDDPDYQPWISAFRQRLQELGWVEGRNVRIDIRWATTNPGEIRKQAAELAALVPDVILAPGRVPDHRRPSRRRLRRQSGAAGPQRHGLHAVRVQH